MTCEMDSATNASSFLAILSMDEVVLSCSNISAFSSSLGARELANLMGFA